MAYMPPPPLTPPRPGSTSWAHDHTEQSGGAIGKEDAETDGRWAQVGKCKACWEAKIWSLCNSLCGTANCLPIPCTFLYIMARNLSTAGGVHPTDQHLWTAIDTPFHFPRSAVAPLVWNAPSNVCNGHHLWCWASPYHELRAKLWLDPESECDLGLLMFRP